MKTTNVILVGVVGVGAVGAYMYMKNKKAQDDLLSGSLPATTPSGTPLLATPPLVSNPVGNLSTTTDGVNPSDANVNLANATIIDTERKRVFEQSNAKIKSTSTGRITGGSMFGNPLPTTTSNAGAVMYARQQLILLDKKLADLGYKVDATGSLVRI
jgi:hypothetical protein